jgi:hypothetical protein
MDLLSLEPIVTPASGGRCADIRKLLLMPLETFVVRSAHVRLPLMDGVAMLLHYCTSQRISALVFNQKSAQQQLRLNRAGAKAR